jgi:hypothetical protein
MHRGHLFLVARARRRAADADPQRLQSAKHRDSPPKWSPHFVRIRLGARDDWRATTRHCRVLVFRPSTRCVARISARMGRAIEAAFRGGGSRRDRPSTMGARFLGGPLRPARRSSRDVGDDRSSQAAVIPATRRRDVAEPVRLLSLAVARYNTPSQVFSSPLKPGNTASIFAAPRCLNATSENTERKSVVSARSRPSLSCSCSRPGHLP